MKLYGGIDLHSNNSVIRIIDEQGVSQLKKKVANVSNRLTCLRRGAASV